jgi:hypothetical protein
MRSGLAWTQAHRASGRARQLLARTHLAQYSISKPAIPGLRGGEGLHQARSPLDTTYRVGDTPALLRPSSTVPVTSGPIDAWPTNATVPSACGVNAIRLADQEMPEQLPRLGDAAPHEPRPVAELRRDRVGQGCCVERPRAQRLYRTSEQRHAMMPPAAGAAPGPIGGRGRTRPAIDPLAGARDKAPSPLAPLSLPRAGLGRHGPTIPATVASRKPAGRSRAQIREIGRRWFIPLGESTGGRPWVRGRQVGWGSWFRPLGGAGNDQAAPTPNRDSTRRSRARFDAVSALRRPCLLAETAAADPPTTWMD